MFTIHPLLFRIIETYKKKKKKNDQDFYRDANDMIYL